MCCVGCARSYRLGPRLSLSNPDQDASINPGRGPGATPVLLQVGGERGERGRRQMGLATPELGGSGEVGISG